MKHVPRGAGCFSVVCLQSQHVGVYIIMYIYIYNHVYIYIYTQYIYIYIHQDETHFQYISSLQHGLLNHFKSATWWWNSRAPAYSQAKLRQRAMVTDREWPPKSAKHQIGILGPDPTHTVRTSSESSESSE